MLAASAVAALAFAPTMQPGMGAIRSTRVVMEEEAAPKPAPVVKSTPKKETVAITKFDVESPLLERIDDAINGAEKPWGAGSAISTVDGMKALAKAQNPIVGFWDPLNIVTEDTAPETIGWFRHAEIKHGRVAMAAFVGYLVQSNGVYWPWALTGLTDPNSKVMFADISAAGSPGDQWDALPTLAKCQILVAVGILELIGEMSPVLEANGEKHYVRGGKPGYYPPFKGFFNENYNVHPLPLNLFDPFGLTKKMTAEQKEKSLLAEVNNGRLAMIGIFGMLSASKGLIVPGLDSLGLAQYSGAYMGPFTAADADLPFVTYMLEITKGLVA